MSNAAPRTSSIETAREELLALHAADRAAHFATDAAALIAAQGEPLISVRDGVISSVTRDEALHRFTTYFAGATYLEWDDLQPPIVEVADDASLGWMIVRVRVRRSQPDSAGNPREQTFIYAGITTYARRNGAWVQTANVSTFEPISV